MPDNPDHPDRLGIGEDFVCPRCLGELEPAPGDTVGDKGLRTWAAIRKLIYQMSLYYARYRENCGKKLSVGKMQKWVAKGNKLCGKPLAPAAL